MTPFFPRTDDGLPRAWGLGAAAPVEIWERFSPAYEAQAERIVRALAARGLTVRIAGAGSEDGEYVTASAGGETLLLIHLEDPAEARRIAALDDAALAEWLDRNLA